MKKYETNLKGVYILEAALFGDHRGFFMETWSKKVFSDLGLEYDFVQDNQSYSAKKGTLRGLHFQRNPMAQAKLVRCLQGEIMDVAVDLRKGSPTYKQWASVLLSESNKRMFLIPRGFAHGFLTLTDDVVVCYKCDNYYSKADEGSIFYRDKSIGIDWGEGDFVLSGKDNVAPSLEECNCNFLYEE